MAQTRLYDSSKMRKMPNPAELQRAIPPGMTGGVAPGPEMMRPGMMGAQRGTAASEEEIAKKLDAIGFNALASGVKNISVAGVKKELAKMAADGWLSEQKYGELLSQIDAAAPAKGRGRSPTKTIIDQLLQAAPQEE